MSELTLDPRSVVAPGAWLRLTSAVALSATFLAVISGVAGHSPAHRLLAGLAAPPLAALVVVAYCAHRRLLPASASAFVLFGAAAALTPRPAHVVLASGAFAATAVAAWQAWHGQRATRGTLRDYATLTKPRIMSLLLLTGACGLIVGWRGMPPAGRFGTTLLGLAFACGGASALNHLLDRDIDRLMGKRTDRRPVAAGRLSPAQALEFGLALSAFSFVLLASLVNLLSAVLALLGNLFYVCVYTRWLKRTTPQNIVIGGAAGAIPPLVGYAAAYGHLGGAAWWMFAIVFFWTPPHFWALALLLEEKYAAASVPMLPVVRGRRVTVRQIVGYSALLVLSTVLPAAVGTFGSIYLTAAAVLGVGFLVLAIRLARRPNGRNAAQLFHASLLYLALLFVSMAVDALL